MSDEKSGLNRRGFLGALGALGIAPEAVKQMVADKVSVPTFGTVKSVASKESLKFVSGLTSSARQAKNLTDTFRMFKNRNHEINMDWWVLRDKLETAVRSKYPHLYNDSIVHDIEESPFKTMARWKKKEILQEEAEEKGKRFRELMCEEGCRWLNDTMDKIPITRLSMDMHQALNMMCIFQKEFGQENYAKCSKKYENLQIMNDLLEAQPYDSYDEDKDEVALDSPEPTEGRGTVGW